MKPKEMKELFIKYIKRECTKEEVQQIVNYFKDSKDLSDVPTIEVVYELLNRYPDMEEITANRIHNNILEIVRNKQKRLFKVKYHLLKYAAVAVIFLGIGYFYQQGYFANEAVFNIPSESITLKLDNGNIQIINEDGSAKVLDTHGHVVGSQSGNQLTYSTSIIKEKLVYNTLTVPYGKQFNIQLSDGTVVNLNAGTSLRYPVKFVKGENRSVFLKGEAYFNVAKDTSHPFIVNAEDVNIHVLGTKFNVSTYPENQYINTVLVEGSVSLYSSESSIEIVPGELAQWHKFEKKMTVSHVDTSIYTDWKNGVLNFNHQKFKNIITKLKRYYNVEIVCNNQKLNEEVFTARFENVTIEHVFSSFKGIYNIDFKIENNQIIIN